LPSNLGEHIYVRLHEVDDTEGVDVSR